MADNRPWIKLWKTFTRDPDIKRLGIEGEARWIRLLLFVAENGTEGAWTGPMNALVHATRFTGIGERGRRQTGRFLQHLPGVTVTVQGDAQGMSGNIPGTYSEHSPSIALDHGQQAALLHDPLTVTVTFRNWSKYQESNSIHRTRRWRGKRHGDGTEASQASPEQASQASPNVTRSRSRLDKNPLTPLSVHASKAQPPTHIPHYPEPEPEAHKAAMQSLKEILENAKPIPPPPPRIPYVPKHPPHYQPDKQQDTKPADDPWSEP